MAVLAFPFPHFSLASTGDHGIHASGHQASNCFSRGADDDEEYEFCSWTQFALIPPSASILTPTPTSRFIHILLRMLHPTA